MITLTSSIVIPGGAVEAGRTQVQLCRLSEIDLTECLWGVCQNFHGHAPTIAVLEALAGRTLPTSIRGFWDGEGYGLSVRPKAGVRGGGDREVHIEDLEAVLYQVTTPQYRDPGVSDFEGWALCQIKHSRRVYSQWVHEDGYLPPAISELSHDILLNQPDARWQAALANNYPTLTSDGEWWRKGEKK